MLFTKPQHHLTPSNEEASPVTNYIIFFYLLTDTNQGILTGAPGEINSSVDPLDLPRVRHPSSIYPAPEKSV